MVQIAPRRWLALCATMASLALPVHAQDMELRLAHVFPEITTVGAAAKEFADLVGQRTDGRITVSVFPAGQLGGDEAIGRELGRGSIDLAFVNPNSLVGLDPLFDFHILPYIATDYDAVDAIFYNPDGIIQQTLSATLERHGMKAIGYFENDFRGISNDRHTVASVADLQGLKLRVVPSQTLTLFFEKAGANVITLPFPELFTALQQGTVDGQENGAILTWQSQFFETQDYFTVSNHSYVMSTITASEDLWDSLAEEDRQIFLQTAQEVGTKQVQRNREVREQALKELMEKGVEVTELTPEQFAEFRALGEQVWEELTPVYGQERMDQLRELIANAKPE